MSDTGLGMSAIESEKGLVEVRKPLVRMLNTDLNAPDELVHETLVCPHCSQKPVIMLLPTKDLTGKGIKFKAELPIDFCIADIVRSLNAKGIETRVSCCGHAAGNLGSIELMDGRELLVKRAKVAEKKPRNSQSSQEEEAKKEQ